MEQSNTFYYMNTTAKTTCSLIFNGQDQFIKIDIIYALFQEWVDLNSLRYEVSIDHCVAFFPLNNKWYILDIENNLDIM